MGKPCSRAPWRALLVIGALVIGIVPITAVRAAQPSPEPVTGPAAVRRTDEDTLDPQRRCPAGFIDDAAKVSLTPPAGWHLAPVTSLNPVTDPASSVYELARFQLRVGDPTLYAQPIPITSGLIQDAGAVLGVGLAREESELLGLDLDPRTQREELATHHGFVTFDEDATYDGSRHLRPLLRRTRDRAPDRHRGRRARRRPAAAPRQPTKARPAATHRPAVKRAGATKRPATPRPLATPRPAATVRLAMPWPVATPRPARTRR